MKGENSVERAERMIRDLDMEIDFLRGCELETSQHIKELDEQLTMATQEFNDILDQKMDALCTKRALKEFIRNGGGLDMYV